MQGLGSEARLRDLAKLRNGVVENVTLLPTIWQITTALNGKTTMDPPLLIGALTLRTTPREIPLAKRKKMGSRSL